MSWIGGLAEWTEGDTLYLSIAFTWKIDEARARAVFARACGKRVVAGGPALFLPSMREELADVAEVPTRTVVDEDGETHILPGTLEGSLQRHNPLATTASRGCPVGCGFCIVPAMEGKEFTLLPDFPVLPVLCDNNLSALPAEYQDYIIERYVAKGVLLTDANSGFEPRTFTEEVYRRWAPLINAGRGPWRFAYDDMAERDEVHAIMKMLRNEPAKRKRVYVLIGNEPFGECMQRIEEVIAAGCEPHVQPYIKLVAMEREPHRRFDWKPGQLQDVARWANQWVWRGGVSFEQYDRTMKKNRQPTYDAQQGLFTFAESA